MQIPAMYMYTSNQAVCFIHRPKLEEMLYPSQLVKNSLVKLLIIWDHNSLEMLEPFGKYQNNLFFLSNLCCKSPSTGRKKNVLVSQCMCKMLEIKVSTSLSVKQVQRMNLKVIVQLLYNHLNLCRGQGYCFRVTENFTVQSISRGHN